MQKELVKKCINTIIEAAKEAFNRLEPSKKIVSSRNIWDVMMLAVNIFHDIIFSIKNPAFEKDDEWRLIKVITDDHKPELIKFRTSQNGFVIIR